MIGRLLYHSQICKYRHVLLFSSINSISNNTGKLNINYSHYLKNLNNLKKKPDKPIQSTEEKEILYNDRED
jgi:hypothetical protein